MNSCVFCLEESPPLLYNVKCRCNFYFHRDCYELYNKKTICPLCRNEVGHLFSPVDMYLEYVQPVGPTAVAAAVYLPTIQPVLVQGSVLQHRRIPRTWFAVVYAVTIVMIVVLIIYVLH
jgi:hypothetical protein